MRESFVASIVQDTLAAAFANCLQQVGYEASKEECQEVISGDRIPSIRFIAAWEATGYISEETVKELLDAAYKETCIIDALAEGRVVDALVESLGQPESVFRSAT
jgi:hypothetical protein